MIWSNQLNLGKKNDLGVKHFYSSPFDEKDFVIGWKVPDFEFFFSIFIFFSHIILFGLKMDIFFICNANFYIQL